MIYIKPSPTADTRTCNVDTVDIDTLKESSWWHIRDVNCGLNWFSELLSLAGGKHDADKITDIDKFYADFKTGFKNTEWWENHKKISRHHFTQKKEALEDVNLIDVLEMITDCVMAGMARSGEVYPINIDKDTLCLAFDNTVKMLKENVEVLK